MVSGMINVPIHALLVCFFYPRTGLGFGTLLSFHVFSRQRSFDLLGHESQAYLSLEHGSSNLNQERLLNERKNHS
jgi:hypothetical protein